MTTGGGPQMPPPLLWRVGTTADGAVVRLGVMHGPPGAPSVMLLHGFAQNHRAFVAPGRSLAGFLSQQGLTVMLAELRGRDPDGTAAVSRDHGFAHHVEEDAEVLLRMALEEATGPLVLAGHSMGALVAAALPERLAKALAGRALLCPPWAFVPHLVGPLRGAAGAVLKRWPLEHLPTQRLGPVFAGLHGALDVAWPVLALAVWAPRSADPDVMRWVMRKSFVAESPRVLADLVAFGRGGTHAGAVPLRARVEAMQGPVLVAGGGRDGLAVEEGVRGVWEALPGAARHRLVVWPDAGHVDLLVGKSAPERLWMELLAFVLAAAAGADPHPKKVLA